MNVGRSWLHAYCLVDPTKSYPSTLTPTSSPSSRPALRRSVLLFPGLNHAGVGHIERVPQPAFGVPRPRAGPRFPKIVRQERHLDGARRGRPVLTCRGSWCLTTLLIRPVAALSKARKR